jgi:coenzyme F420 hydrogenase subunit beta
VRTGTGKGFVDSAVRNRKLEISPGVETTAIEKLAAAKIRKNTKK